MAPRLETVEDLVAAGHGAARMATAYGASAQRLAALKAEWDPRDVFPAHRYRVTAFDNRGAGRMPLPDGELTVELMADIAAAILEALDIDAAHVAGFSGGGMNAPELALRHPDKVRSLVLNSTFTEFDAYLQAAADNWRWMIETAPSERAALEAFFLWVYTPRAHADGTVAAIVEDALAYPHPQSTEAFVAELDAWARHSTANRIHAITAPTLVLAGGADLMAHPYVCRAVADAIPGARFAVLPGEAHQPFQEVPDVWNDRVDAFWRSVDAVSARARAGSIGG